MKKALLRVGIAVIVVAVIVGAALLVITHDFNDKLEAVEASANPYIVKTGETMVSAHRSGGGIAPENTLMAFENCAQSSSFAINIFEFDLHITKDGELILLHDDTFDRTSNAAEHFGKSEIRPEDYTYDELRALNMGEFFTTDSGETPYAGLRGDDIPDNLRVVKLRDIFDYLSDYGEYRFIIEIKNGEELGKTATDKLYSILKEYDMLDRVIVGTFQGEISEYMESTYPEMLRSAGIKEVFDFYFSSLLGIAHEDGYYKFDALQIPDDDYVFNLGTTRLVNYAHKYNIAVQYWTINEPEDVKHLQSIGADAVMSDNPDMAYKVIKGEE